MALLVIGYLAIESFAQRRVETLLLRVTVLLAMVSAVLLAMFYARELVLLGLGGARPVHPDRQRPGADPPLTRGCGTRPWGRPSGGRGGHARDDGDVA